MDKAYMAALLETEWQGLLNKDDRTSPAEHPDMCLITRAELAEIIGRVENPWFSGEDRTHGIEVQDLREGGEDGGGLLGFWSRGHHDRWKFAEAVNHYTGADIDYDIRHVSRREDMRDVRHEWWRTVPASGEPGCVFYHQAEPHSRGAFAVTVTTVVEDRERRRTQREIDQFNSGNRHGFAAGLNWALHKLDRINPEAGEALLAEYRERNKA